MKWFWFPVAVVATSIALLVALVAAVALPARAAFASALGAGLGWSSVPGAGAPWAKESGYALPSELQGLSGIPADERFSHFTGAQLNLKDKDGKALVVSVTPGTVTAASAT